VAQRHSGYLVGGTSPFGLRKPMPVYVERTVLALPRIWINGGRRGYLVGLEPQVCVRLLGVRPVDCAISPTDCHGAGSGKLRGPTRSGIFRREHA